ncbi:Cap [Lactuca sativa CRESS virus]|nr:Cap [Lactuca sativa CRESS virus]
MISRKRPLPLTVEALLVPAIRKVARMMQSGKPVATMVKSQPRSGMTGYLRGKNYRTGRKVFKRSRYTRRVMRNGKYVRKTVYGRRRYRNAIATKRNRVYRGSAVVNQNGDTTSSPNTVSFVEQSCPLLTMYEQSFFAVYRMLFKKAGYDVDDPSLVLRNWGTNSLCQLVWRRVHGSPTSTLEIAGVASETFSGLVIRMQQALDTVAPNVLKNTIFESVSIRTEDQKITIMKVKDCIIDFLCVTNLKMQNRSRSVVGDAFVDELDRVPVRGYVMYGKGSGPIVRTSQQGLNLGTNGQFSVSAYAGATLGDFGRVIPQAYDITNCSRDYKFTLDPGNIRTEIITDKIRIVWHKLCRYVISMRDDPGLGDGVWYHNFGHFKYIVYEKVIGNVGGNNQDISINWETETKIYTGVENKEESYFSKYIGSAV